MQMWHPKNRAKRVLYYTYMLCAYMEIRSNANVVSVVAEVEPDPGHDHPEYQESSWREGYEKIYGVFSVVILSTW